MIKYELSTSCRWYFLTWVQLHQQTGKKWPSRELRCAPPQKIRFIFIWICPLIGKPPTVSITPMRRRWCYWQCSDSRRDLKVATIMLITVSSCRLFHAGIVFTKNEFLNTVVFALMFLNLYGWFARVRGSAGVRMSSTVIAAKWFTMLHSNISLKSRLTNREN